MFQILIRWPYLHNCSDTLKMLLFLFMNMLKNFQFSKSGIEYGHNFLTS
jgi:hypothetical protein